jgi:Uma2 family endonuclease
MAVSDFQYPRTRRWTRAEYDRLVEIGVFRPGERIELLDGQLVVREPQSSGHTGGIRRVVETLRRALDPAVWQIDSQFPFALDDDSEPEPDVAVVPYDAEHYRHAHPSRAVLLVEVSGSSYRIDRRFKAGLYARAAVPEYWIVALTRGTLEIHRAPEASGEAAYGWRYGSVEVLAREATVTPLFAPSVVIAVADLIR